MPGVCSTRRWLTGAVAGGLVACAPSLPGVEPVLQTVDLRVEIRRADDAQRLVLLPSGGAEVPLEMRPFESTFARSRPFFAGPAWRHVIIQTEERSSDEGRMREAHYLLRVSGGQAAVVCTWPGNEHHRDERLRGLLRTSRLVPVTGADPPAFDIERIDYNRTFEGQKERIVTRVVLPPAGPCDQQVASHTTNAPQGGG